MTSKRPRLAFVVTDAISLNSLMRGQLEYLKARGADIEMFCGGSREERQALIARGIGPVHHVPMRRPPSLFWDLVGLVWLTLALAPRRFDTVVCSTPKALLLGSLAAMLTGQKRRIAWIRGRAYERATGLGRRVYLAFDRLTGFCSHQVLLISRSLAAAYEADGLTFAGKARVLGAGSSNGVDLERFQPLAARERQRLRKTFSLDVNAFVIVVVGRLTADKGTYEALNLAERLGDLPSLRWIFVGAVEEDGIAPRLAEIPQVQWLPQTSQVEQIFQVADLHLFLSHREGFGNVAVEAAAAGVATLAFDVVGVRDSVIDGQTGRLFAFGDLDGVEAEIRSAYGDRKAFAARYNGAREAVRTRFDREQVWARYADAFLGEGG